MNDPIEHIQASGNKAVLVVTGGGISAINTLLAHPGASRFVLEACIPYSYPALIDYVGEDIQQSVCEETACHMAEVAYERGRKLDPFEPVIGIACTAALQTRHQRKGADRAFLCIKSANDQKEQQVEIPKGTRTEQEAYLSAEIIHFIAHFIGVV